MMSFVVAIFFILERWMANWVWRGCDWRRTGHTPWGGAPSSELCTLEKRGGKAARGLIEQVVRWTTAAASSHRDWEKEFFSYPCTRSRSLYRLGIFDPSKVYRRIYRPLPCRGMMRFWVVPDGYVVTPGGHLRAFFRNKLEFR
jgi:hypothetical protein